MQLFKMNMGVRWALQSMIVIFVLFAVSCSRNSARDMLSEADRIESVKSRERFRDALDVLQKIEAVDPYFEDCYGAVLFPTVGKGGIGVGAAFGKGYVFRKGVMAGQSTLTQLSLGFQWGGKAYSQIIFFENHEAYERFTHGNFEFGSKASAVTVGGDASVLESTAGVATPETQSRAEYHNGVAVFVVSKGGLMYDAGLVGQKFSYAEL